MLVKLALQEKLAIELKKTPLMAALRRSGPRDWGDGGAKHVTHVER